MSDEPHSLGKTIGILVTVILIALAAAGVLADLNYKIPSHILLILAGILCLLIIYLAMRQSWSDRNDPAGLSIAPRLSLPPKPNTPSLNLPTQESKPEKPSYPIKGKTEEKTRAKPPKSNPNLYVKQDAGSKSIPFHGVDEHAHRYYIQEEIQNIIWRWHYKLEFDNTPRNLTPFCRECGRPLTGQHTQEVVSLPDTNKHYGVCELWCLAHPRVHRIHTDRDGDFILIKKHIEQRIQDGSWLELVNKERMLRRESPISPSLVAPLAKSQSKATLNDMQTDILLVLWRNSPSCKIHDLILDLLHRRKAKGEPSFDGGTFYFHLNDLVDKDFVEMTYDTLKRPDRCTLTQQARKYIVNNNLLDSDEKSN